MMRKWRVTRIGLWTAAKIGCGVSCIAGFLFGLFWGVVFAFFSSLFAMAVSGYNPGIGVGVMAVLPVFCTVLFGVFGTAASFILALAYNLTAGAFGGIELELETENVEERMEDDREMTLYGAI